MTKNKMKIEDVVEVYESLKVIIEVHGKDKVLRVLKSVEDVEKKPKKCSST